MSAAPVEVGKEIDVGEEEVGEEEDKENGYVE